VVNVERRLKSGCSRLTACSLTNAERRSHTQTAPSSNVLTTCIPFHTDKDILEALHTQPFAHPLSSLFSPRTRTSEV